MDFRNVTIYYYESSGDKSQVGVSVINTENVALASLVEKDFEAKVRKQLGFAADDELNFQLSDPTGDSGVDCSVPLLLAAKAGNDPFPFYSLSLYLWCLSIIGYVCEFVSCEFVNYEFHCY